MPLLRPQRTQRFEMVIAHEDMFPGLRCLAETQAVELHVPAKKKQSDLSDALEAPVQSWRQLASRYQAYLPAPQWPVELKGDPATVAATAIGALHAWEKEAAPLVNETQRLARETRRQEHYLALAKALQPSLQLSRLSQFGPFLTVRFAIYQGAWPDPLPDYLSAWPIEGTIRAILFAGMADRLDALLHHPALAKAEWFPVPSNWTGENQAIIAQLVQDLTQMAHRQEALMQRLEAMADQFDLALHLGRMAEVAALLPILPGLSPRGILLSMQGWSALASVQELNRSLAEHEVRAIARAQPPPTGEAPPLVLHNPRWAQPFEWFIRAFGTPGANEADPSVLLAFMAPLMFGYMFGDVGQGGLLVLMGILLSRRYPLARMLVPGGAMAVCFGLLYGSCFSMQGLLRPLWMDPLQAPLDIMLLPLAWGVIVISLGMLLSAQEAAWAGQLKGWVYTQAGVAFAYWGALLSVAWHTLGVGTMVAALAWHFLAGPLSRQATFTQATGTFLEAVMQLAVNTLSFVRIGAFALSHAGLSLATVSISTMSHNPVLQVMVMVLGNLLVMVLETLVVSVQTARLILLEFFLRFAGSHGRLLRPLQWPGISTPQRKPT